MTEAKEDTAGSPRKPAGPRQPVTVITGGSEGIGLELAREFARAGNDLLLVARTQKNLERAADQLTRAFGVTVHGLAVDLSTEEGCRSLAVAIEDNGLYVRYLVNDAGFGVEGLFAEIDPQRLVKMVDLNVRAVTDLTRRFLPGMVQRNEGGVLNLGSLAGFAPGPYQQVYYASKAYIISLTQAIAHEVRHTNVRISVVTPGPVSTDFHARMGAEKAYYMLFGMMQPDAVAKIAYANFMCRQRVIAPGILNMLNHVLLRLMPRALLVPFMGLLLRQRDAEGHVKASGNRAG